MDIVLSEILFNAVKANVKRVYFTDKNLDIHNAEHYEQGMKNFRMDTLVIYPSIHLVYLHKLLELLQVAEKEAIRRGCHSVHVDTMSWQAPDAR